MNKKQLAGIKSAETIKERFGADHHAKMGAKGGKKTGVKKGFASMSRERLLEVSRKGGSLGKRTKAS